MIKEVNVKLECKVPIYDGFIDLTARNDWEFKTLTHFTQRHYISNNCKMYELKNMTAEQAKEKWDKFRIERDALKKWKIYTWSKDG